MLSGGCNCGAVQFEIRVAVSDVYVCHCSICRRFSGSNGLAVVVVPNEQFRWTQGSDRVACWDKPGHDWQANFCSTCGSALPGANDPERMFVPAGAIVEGGDALRVVHHIWVDSRAPWDVIGDAGIQHRCAFEASSTSTRDG